MLDGRLPLFPLPLVLLPQNPLPLHIFEERYRQMIGRAIEDGSEFGVVMTADGGIVNAGCTAMVERVLERFPDGRFNIATVGRKRFEVQSIDEELAFLRGEVSFINDVEEEISVELSQAALAVGPPREGVGPLLSFDLSRNIRDLAFRQQMLITRSENERLRMLIDFFPSQSQRTAYRDRMRILAVKNGKGHHGSAGQEGGSH